MAVVSLKFDRGGPAVIFGGYIKRLNDPTPALEQIGIEMVTRTQKGFDEQGRDKPWPPRGVPNIPAIARRLSSGKNILPRYYEGRKALIDSGDLRNTIAKRVVRNTVIIGTGLKYGIIHQEGRTSVVNSKVPQLVQQGNKRVVRELKKLAKKFPKAAKFLEKADTIKTKVRKRAFLVIIKDDIDMALDVLRNHVLRGGDGSTV